MTKDDNKKLETSGPQPSPTSMVSSDLSKILLAGNYVTEENVKEASEFAKKNKSSVVDYFLTKGLVTKDLLGQAVAEHYKVSYADLNTKIPPKEQVLKIPQDLAVNYRLVLFSEGKEGLVVTSDHPDQLEQLRSQLQTLFPNKKISFAYSLSDDIEACFVHYQKPMETRFQEIIATQIKVAPEIIGAIIGDALTLKASDIHFEPRDKEVIIRFRIDGVLAEEGRIPKDVYENILNRIKVQANLRIDEHFSAQDGAMRFAKDEHFVDMRVSVVPTLDGEKIAIRLLAEYVKGFTFSDLGISDGNQETLLTNVKKPFGMILVTGPTGSGKTTTLYAVLKMLNQPGINITTIEDPVEYKIEGVNQIQVNPQTNLTFAKGLRSIIRQDPNIILVGEIRDLETAEIAVNAALTGHLLLSTFHANDAATSIPRLLDMGAEPFLLASTLELVLAQRLVRRICENCRTSYQVDKSPYFSGKAITLYKGKGCKNCNNTGFKGRTAIFESIEVTSQMEDLILKHPAASQVWELAKRQGSHSLFEDGLQKVKTGVTTLEELLRVALPPQEYQKYGTKG